MKTILSIAGAVGLVLTLLTGCTRTEVRALKNLNNTRWQVETIRFQKSSGPDSLATPTDFTLTFESCSKQENQTECDLLVRTGGRGYFFAYKVGEQDEGFKRQPIVVIAIQGNDTSPGYLQTAKSLVGTYSIVEQTDEKLVLFNDNVTLSHPYKTREITARRLN